MDSIYFDEWKSFAVQCKALSEADESDPALEGWFDTIVEKFHKLVSDPVSGFIGHMEEVIFRTHVAEIINTLKLKGKLRKGKPYLELGATIVGRPSMLKGDLSDFAELYLFKSGKLSHAYEMMLGTFVKSIIDTTAQDTVSHSAYASELEDVLDTEKEFNKLILPFMGKTTRDTAEILELLPNEDKLITFCRTINNNVEHPLLSLKYFTRINHLLRQASIGMTNYNKNGAINDKKIMKSLARDGFAIAEMANSLVGRSYTCNQLVSVRDEVARTVLEN